MPAPRKRPRAILDALFAVLARRSPLLDDAKDVQHVIAQMIRDLPGAKPSLVTPAWPLAAEPAPQGTSAIFAQW